MPRNPVHNEVHIPFFKEIREYYFRGLPPYLASKTSAILRFVF